MKNLYFDDFEDFSCAVADAYDALDYDDEDVAIIAKYEEARQIIKELLCIGYDIHSINIIDEEYGEYDAEYIISLYDDEVWCECECSDAIDYQPEADAAGMRNGKFIPVKAMLTRIPEDGFYRYKTSPMMLVKWIIAGSMKVNRILPDDEVAQICKAAGYEALPRKTI